MCILEAMKAIVIAIILGLVLLVSIVSIAELEAKPFFTKKTNNKIIGLIKSDPNCPPEFYARATPKNNNHVLLNKEDIPNDHGSMHKFSWYYDINKIKQTASTNEGKIRAYVVGVDVFDVQTGEVVTHYKSIVAGKKTVDVGVFDMRGKSACS